MNNITALTFLGGCCRFSLDILCILFYNIKKEKKVSKNMKLELVATCLFGLEHLLGEEIENEKVNLVDISKYEGSSN